MASKREPISRPAFERVINLQTLQAQKVLRRAFDRASNSLYLIDVILRIIGDEGDAERVEAVIHTMMTEIEEGLTAEFQRQQETLEENGITALAVYDAPHSETVRITSPHVSRYLTMILRLDEVIQHIDTLWLSGVMSNKDRNDAVYRWQQKIIGLGSRIIGLERRARSSATRQGKNEEVDAVAPAADESPESASKTEDAPAADAAAVKPKTEPAKKQDAADTKAATAEDEAAAAAPEAKTAKKEPAATASKAKAKTAKKEPAEKSTPKTAEVKKEPTETKAEEKTMKKSAPQEAETKLVANA